MPFVAVNVDTESCTRKEQNVSLFLMPDRYLTPLLLCHVPVFFSFSDRSAKMSNRPTDIGELYTLEVDNISYRTVKDDLDSLFGKYGKIGDIYIPKDG